MTESNPQITEYPKSEALYQRACESIAGGVVSLNRKTTPRISFVRGQGSKIWDADGNEYIDYHAAFAPHLLGHNVPVVNDAVRRAMDEGWSLMGSGTTPWEAQLGDMLCAAVPSLERVQLTNTGTEATAHAIRLSRAWTGRDDIILTLGGYNGWHNEVARQVSPALSEIGPRVTAGEYPFISMSAGIPEGTRRLVHIVNFNDADSVEYVMKKYPIACILTEPVLQNVGVIPPQPGYLESLRELCDRHGAMLVFDEVKTGFRSALGGYQSIAGVRPDLSVFGKAVANGHPIGVIGGREDIMMQFDDADPKKRVLIAGTFNGHPVPVAASIATIQELQRDGGAVYAKLESLGARLQNGLQELFAAKGITVQISRIGSAFCVYFCDHIPRDWHDMAENHNADFDRAYRAALIHRGIYHFPIPAKQGSISASHTEEDIDHTLQVTRDALQSL
ncbi:MAG: aspartate aminotransferase family protein [Candidatus Sumerlaeaceae bacterium]